MQIEHLACFKFRNLAQLELAPGSAVILRGNNGQGKTNLLEALYVCATGRSFRHARPRELLQFGAERGWVKANFVRQGVRHHIEAQITPRRRTMRVDDRSIKHMSALLELMNVVAFFPDDLRIAKGGPEERRRFLDRAIANYRPELVDASLAYARALRSRNALLRAAAAPDRAVLEAYDEQLIKHGAVIHRCRVEGLEALVPIAAERFASIMSTTGPLGVGLKSGVPGQEDISFDEALRDALVQAYPRDRARGMTTVGPHRADLLLSLGDRDARVYASQGQQRAMVLALKLAEVACLQERLGCAPILLLDDVSSELDGERTELLFDALAGTGSQLWVSTTGATPLPLGRDAEIFEVEGGGIVRVQAQ